MKRPFALLLAASVAACGDDPAGGPGDGGVPPDGTVPDPPTEKLVINEFMASNALTSTDKEDWIEIWNPTSEDVNLAGWGLTDALDVKARVTLGDAVVPAGGLIVVKALPLQKEGGEIGLSDPEGEWHDRVHYGPQATDLSAARSGDGSAEWKVQWKISPGESNGTGQFFPANDDVEEVPGAGDISETLLGDDAFNEFELIIPEASEAELRAHPKLYVEAQIKYDGRTLGPVGVRLKGQNSFQPYDQKPSFKVKMDMYDEDAELFGLAVITLNAMNSDPTMMREVLAYRLVRARGVAASRAAHAWVKVNGNDYGLYVAVETVKPRMMSRFFTNNDGQLWEGAEADFTPELIPMFQFEAGLMDDRSRLMQLSDALALPPAEALAAAEDLVDMDAFIEFWAALSVIGQFDGFPFSLDDYFIYLDPTTNKLHFMPWGMDESMERWWRFVENTPTMLATKCLAVSSCKNKFHDAVWDTYDMTQEMNVLDEIDRIETAILPKIEADTRMSHTDALRAEKMEGLRNFWSRREKDLKAEIGPP